METRLRAARRGRRVRLPDRRGLLHARHPADPQGPARATRRPSTRRSSARASAQASVSTARATGIYGSLPLFTDGKTHSGSSLHSSATTTLYRNGTKVGSNSDPLEGAGIFKVPAGDAAYKLTTSVKRSVKVAAAFTRVDASWTFRSKKADLDKLPASLIRFDAAVGLDSRAPANKKVSVPVTVQGSAAGSNLKSLSVYVSYDYGQTWKKATVKNGKIAVTNPAKGKGISFHAKIADKKGNKSTISLYNAYYGK